MDDMMKAFEQIAAQADDEQRRIEIEAYITTVTTRVTDSLRSHLFSSNIGLPEPTYSELEKWASLHRARLSLQFGQLVQTVLRKELLGEAKKD